MVVVTSASFSCHQPAIVRRSLAALARGVALAGGLAITALTASGARAAPHALLVVDANTGTTLLDQAGSEPRFPASLTKMMTLYLVFEAIEAGKASLRTPIRISARAAAAAPSKLGLDEGATIALEDAMKALITKSANDIAVAVAEHFGGTEEAFAAAMTAKARDLGMMASLFRNASGLPDPAQATTARDMVTLTLALFDGFPRHVALFATRRFPYQGKTYRTHNTLMLHMPGIDGMKTGYTHASGFNLVTSYRADGRHLIAAIFGGDSAGKRNAAVRVALTRVLSRASKVRSRKPVAVAAARARMNRLTPPAKGTAAITPPRPVPAVRRPPAVAPEPVDPDVGAPDVGAPSPATPGTATADMAGGLAVRAAEGAPSNDAATSPTPVLGPRVHIARVRPVDAALRTTSTTAPDRPSTEVAASGVEPNGLPVPVDRTAADSRSIGPQVAAAEVAVADVAVPEPVPLATALAAASAEAAPPVEAAEPTLPRFAPVREWTRPAAPAPALPPADSRDNAAAPPPPEGGAPVVVLPPGAVALGRPASSLGAQQAALADPPPPSAVATRPPPALRPTVAEPSYRLSGPPTAPAVAPPAVAAPAAPKPAPRPGAYEIQIGSFATAAEADRQIALVKARATAVVAAHTAVRRQGVVGGRTYERARFTGFDHAGATAACAALQGLAIPCLVTKADSR